MSSSHNGYILDDGYRFLFRYLLPCASGFLIVFSFLFLRPEILDKENAVPNYIASIIFMSIGILLLISRHVYSPIIWMTYNCNAKQIANICNTGTNNIDISKPFFITKLRLTFAARGATWQETFLVLSNCPFSYISNLESGGLRAIKKLQDHGVVILPANQEIFERMYSIAGLQCIPQYPKIAYISSKNTKFRI